jgi:Sigma-70, region 4
MVKKSTVAPEKSLGEYEQACEAILTTLGRLDAFGSRARECLKGVLEGLSYSEIATQLEVSEGTVKARCSALWLALESYFNQDVSRFKVQELLDKYLNGDYVSVATPIGSTEDWPLEIVVHPVKFVGRTSELAEVERLAHHNGISAVIGAAGVGKTALLAQHIYLQKYDANKVIWQTIEPGCRVVDIANAMGLRVEERSDAAYAAAIVEALQTNEYLLVLDQAEVLVQKENSALSLSAYARDYSGYEALIKMLTKRSIRSHVILLSRVMFQDLERARSAGLPVNICHLGGIGPKDAKTVMELHRVSTDNYIELHRLYEGNPGCLRDALHQIINLYGGNIGEFLRATLYLSPGIKHQYKSALEGLSEVEISVLRTLETPLKFIELEERVRQAEINISRGKLIELLEMLERNQLVEAEVDEEKREKRFSANGIAIQCLLH